jgi:hypothetical protein
MSKPSTKEIEANIKGALTSREVAEKALEEPKLNPGAKPFVPASSTNKGGRSHRRKSLKKKTSKRRKYHRRS